MDSEELTKLVETVDAEDAAVFKIKHEVSLWMVTQTEAAEISSRASRERKRSRDPLSLVSKKIW